MTAAPVSPAQHLPGASNKAALDACLADLDQAQPGALALVLEVVGHAYAGAGTLVHFSAAGRRCGWVSPGCLEGDVLAAADAAYAEGRVRLLDLDNRDLFDVFSGAGAGCRGRQRVLVLPLSMLAGLRPILASYRQHDQPLRLRFAASGQLRVQTAELQAAWSLPVEAQVPPADVAGGAWALQWAPLPKVLICGAGPESDILLPLLDQLGWRVDLVEPRADWANCMARVERLLPATPAEGGGYDAVLVMAHHFGRDREVLATLAGWPRLPDYIGLLGPERRREDLLATLPGDVRERLHGRLESPAGLPLGGRGAAAIALSLAARLQKCVQRPDLAQEQGGPPVPESAVLLENRDPPC